MALLMVDDDADLRDTFADVLSSLGHRAVVVGSLAELTTHRGEALGCSLAVLDINLGPGAPSGLAVYRWLKEVGFGGKVVFLTGHGTDDPQVQEVVRAARVEVISKPMGIDRLEEVIAEAEGHR
jgi:DNA-binding NtrC family response regulator